MREKINNLNSDLKGLAVRSVMCNLISKELILILDNEHMLRFVECPMFIDGGIIGKIIKRINHYSGEMGFVISLRGHKIDWDDYFFCYINVGDELPFTQENRMRIAFKDFTFNKSPI